MKKRAMAMIFAVMLLAGCAPAPPAAAEDPQPTEATEEEQMAQYQKISAEEAAEMMKEEGAVVVDVRTPEEYAGGHIDGAVLVPVATLQDTAAEKLPDKDATLLIYCRSGSRSRTASETLIKMGYTRVYDFGGIIDWPYEVVK